MNQILLSFFVHQWRNSLKENPRELDLAYGKLINPSAESLEALLHVLAKEDHHLEDITLPFSMLNKEWLKNFFEVLKRKNPVLCGIAMCNNNVSLFAPMKFYPKANLMALLELEKIMMRSPANVWGYQMQEILLDDKAIEILSTHIMNMQSRNRTITLILSKNSESYHKP